MDTAATGEAMDALKSAGEAFASGWSAARSVIGGLDGQLGKGPLGAAFVAGYRPVAEEVAAAAERGARVPGRLAEAGRLSVTDYVRADVVARAGFDSAMRHGLA